MWWWPKPRRRGEDCESRSLSDQIRLKQRERERERERSKRPKTGRKKVDAIGTIAAMNILRVGQIQGAGFGSGAGVDRLLMSLAGAQRENVRIEGR